MNPLDLIDSLGLGLNDLGIGIPIPPPGFAQFVDECIKSGVAQQIRDDIAKDLAGDVIEAEYTILLPKSLPEGTQ